MSSTLISLLVMHARGRSPLTFPEAKNGIISTWRSRLSVRDTHPFAQNAKGWGSHPPDCQRSPYYWKQLLCTHEPDHAADTRASAYLFKVHLSQGLPLTVYSRKVRLGRSALLLLGLRCLLLRSAVVCGIPNALAASCIVHVPALSAYREAVVVSPEEECPSLDGFGPSINLATTARIASITIKSAESMAAIASAGTHLVVQGTNRTNGT